MPRPCKRRRVRCSPRAGCFKPEGISISRLQEVVLTIDEFEAVRLADLEGLYQEDAAKKMNISRQTFGNIIEAAHKKVADSIVNAKALKIEGGVIRIIPGQFCCSNCNHEWRAEFGTGLPAHCPNCRGKNIRRVPQDSRRRGMVKQ